MKIANLFLAISATAAMNFACANKPSVPASSEVPGGISGEISGPTISMSKKQASADEKLTGRLYFLNLEYLKSGLSAADFKKITDFTRSYLNSLGYEEVPKRRKAHFTVYIFSDYDPQDANPGFRKQRVLSLQIHMQNFGKRQQKIAWLDMRPPDDEWTGYETRLLAAYENQMRSLMPKAPSTNTKMAGDPGCMPRFGYEQDDDKVTIVPKGSPAEVAGIKVGDIITSIDSMTPTEFYEKEDGDAYSGTVQVPMKIQRGDKTIRINIRSKIMCD